MNLSLKIARNHAITFSIAILIAMLLPSCSTLTPQDHYNLAIDYSQKGQPFDAEKEYKNAIQANPDLYQAHNNLGAIYMRQGLLAKAETSFKNALTIKPDYLPAIENLASAIDGLGKKEKEALENWKKAQDLETRRDVKERISQRVQILEARLFPQAPKVSILITQRRSDNPGCKYEDRRGGRKPCRDRSCVGISKWGTPGGEGAGNRWDQAIKVPAG